MSGSEIAQREGTLIFFQAALFNSQSCERHCERISDIKYVVSSVAAEPRLTVALTALAVV